MSLNHDDINQIDAISAPTLRDLYASWSRQPYRHPFAAPDQSRDLPRLQITSVEDLEACLCLLEVRPQ